jgi:glyoxylase-like metal-dependent hydrolase (beta-lactamase superfamily II)
MTTLKPQVQCIFHDATSTCTYIVQDPSSKHAMIIDPVMDFDPAAVRTSQKHNEAVASYCEMEELQVDYIIETHVHADHMTGAEFLKNKFPDAKTAIGENVTKVQSLFKGIFNLETKADNFEPDGTQFDMLLKDEEELELGNIKVRVLYTPGHTPACVSLVVGDAVFTGDTLFMPDMGTARCDFPAGSVENLYNSIQRLYKELPDDTRVFVGHDYAPGGREFAWETTIGQSKSTNKQIKQDTPLEEFSDFRKARDASLNPPRLILPSLQVNLRNGALPPRESNGTSYLKLPLNVLGKDDHA